MRPSNNHHLRESTKDGGTDFVPPVSPPAPSNNNNDITGRISPIELPENQNNNNNNISNHHRQLHPISSSSRGGFPSSVSTTELLMLEEESPENIRRDPNPTVTVPDETEKEIGTDNNNTSKDAVSNDANNTSTAGILDGAEVATVVPDADEEFVADDEEDEDMSDLVEDPNFTSSSFFRPLHFPAGHSFLSVSRHLRKQTLSASFATAVDSLARIIALSAVGRTQSTEVFAGCGIGIAALSILSLSIAVGWASAIDTLASTAYGRLQKKAARIEEVGEITQLGLGLGLILSSFCALMLLLFSRPIVGFVFGEIYVDSASLFLVNAVPFLISFTICTALFKSLQAQHLAIIPSKAAFFGLIATAVGSEVLIPLYGLRGVAWTLLLASVVQIIACLLLAPKTALFRKVPWLPPTRWRRIFTKERVLEYVRIAVPSLISCGSEWWGFELLNVLVARLGERETAAFGIFFNVAIFCWSLAAGVAIAAYSHVGKLLGEGKPMMAFVFARTAMIWAWIFAIGSASIVTIFHNQIYGLYTSDPELLGQLRAVLGIFWLYHQCDNVQYTIQAVFRGAGRQDESVKPILFTIWLIGLPGAYISSHYIHNSLVSLLLGFCAGFVLEIPLLMRKVRQWNWQELAEEAAKKKHEDDEETSHHHHHQVSGGIDMKEKGVVAAAVAPSVQ